MLPQYGTACQHPHVKLDTHAGAPTSLMQDRQQALQQPQARRLPKLPSASACNTARNSKARRLALIRARAAVHRQTDSAAQVQQSSRPVSRVQRARGLGGYASRGCSGATTAYASRGCSGATTAYASRGCSGATTARGEKKGGNRHSRFSPRKKSPVLICSSRTLAA